MKNIFFYLLLTFLTLSACKVKDYNVVTDYLEYKESLDWTGEYLGVTPCADCEGLEITIKLKEDFTYEKRYRYLGKSDKKYFYEGNFKWSEDSLNVELEDHLGQIQAYAMQRDKLIVLDESGNRIEGDLADQYELHKVIETEQKWLLIELNQEPVDFSDFEQIYISIDEKGNKISGFSGCNRFFGEYELLKKKQVVVSKVGMTRMLCEEPIDKIERAFIEALNNTAYHVEEKDELRWVNAEGNKILAYFRK